MLDERLDKLSEECGVFGIYAPGYEVARMAYYGLFALQHRGQESAGIAVTNGCGIQVHKDMGLVAEVFNEDILKKMKGYMGIGHVRYSTTGSSLALNAQPLVCRYLQGSIALAHNGNLTNANELRDKLANNGSVFQSTIDSELIVNLIARYGQNSIEESLMKCMIDIKGSYSLVVMTEEKLIGVRDPFGNRPLCIGKLGKNGYVIASESCALDTIGAEFTRDVQPGEIVIIDKNGLNSQRIFTKDQGAVCIFEYIYFARPDSIIDGISVNYARRNMGGQLAKEAPLDVDVVIAVPDSGTASAIGYAQTAGVPFSQGLLKNRYAGRTFIQPDQNMRELGVKLKLNPIRQEIAGKRVAIVDDSIVRGTTSRKLVEMLRQNGAKEVHMLVSSPPVMYPCYYGIDTSERAELIAAQKSLDEIRQHIGADSLNYLSHKGLFKAMGKSKGFCSACLDGDYPILIPPPEELGKHILETPNGKGEKACARIKD
ncbi:MAG: amidophosphoribosyltransferase [Clostridia bacterium]|jgi:amidophosphoribosyltransferase|nr:amidophosphoribosyltransferase [Clostridia bacterium]MDN5322820.1 amidophosphoribosyltransferase [Clostridia bacterium]